MSLVASGRDDFAVSFLKEYLFYTILLQKGKCNLYLHSLFGGLAQLVQSICLTSRGSAVRTRHPPQSKNQSGQAGLVLFLIDDSVKPC
jgi:hypothetical protein